jgi:ArsR family transcriptional regulator, arsenate/arsenite/antimonite-responsive transcriptional repressor
MDDLGASQSLLSFHLRTLKDAGLVTDRREGRWVHYSLALGAGRSLEECCASLGGARAARPVSCCEDGSSCCEFGRAMSTR